MPSLMKRFEIMVTATLRKNLKPSMLKQNNGSCLQEDQESEATLFFLCSVKFML